MNAATRAAITENQGKLAAAAKAMRAIQEEHKDKPLAALPDNFKQAKADAEAATAALNTLREREAQEDATDRLYASCFDPATGTPKYGEAVRDEATGEVMFDLSKPAPKAVRAGRSYERRLNRIDPRAHAAAFEDFIRGGTARLETKHSAIRNEVMRTNSNELGGFAVPPDFRGELLSDVAASSIMWELCRQIPTTTNEAFWPTLTNDSATPRIYRSGFAGAFTAEGTIGTTAPLSGATPQTLSIGFKRIPVHTWSNEAAPVVFTPEQIEDQGVDLVAILRDIIQETLALDGDNMGFNGSGSGQPTGILNASGVTTVSTGSAGAMTYDGYVNLIFGSTGLPAQYRANATLAMNTDVYAKTLLIKDDNNLPLINVNTTPDRILTYPIRFSEWLPIVASAAKVVVFGDFKQYGMAMRTSLTISQVVGPHAPNTTVYARSRFGGDVLRSAAFKILLAS